MADIQVPYLDNSTGPPERPPSARTTTSGPAASQTDSRSTPAQASVNGPSFVSTLLVSNIHCPSCVSYAEDILRPLPDITKVGISIVDHKIRVGHRGGPATATIIAKELTNAAFEVQHVLTIDSSGHAIKEYEHTSSPPSQPRSHRWWMSKAQRRHIENCDACKQNNASKKVPGGVRSWFAPRRGSRKGPLVNRRDSDIEKGEGFYDIKDEPVTVNSDSAGDSARDGEFRATISIGGMTCASCTSTITKELEGLDIVRAVNVNLMANNATLTFAGPKHNIDKIVESIEDVGYEATVDTVSATTKPQSSRAKDSNARAKVSMSIEGMTCGSCVGTITRGLQELPYVSNVNIDLVGNSGSVEIDDRDKMDSILEKIDDLGYDATIVKVDSLDDPSTAIDFQAERSVTIAIDGMFCEHCPESVVKALVEALGDSISISQAPTMKIPRITIKYTPSPPSLTARHFISIVDSAHEAFTARTYHPPTIEERSRAMLRREQRHILFRVGFTFIVAIPTFIIGIVFMDLVPSTNRTRIWFDEPIWAGNVSRTEWAMFIMTTPVMFFGADVFHRRTFKELRALWRPGSRVPILRRFYRFGSMNLLISAGTSVAYFSSLAVLILDSVAHPDRSGHSRGNYTYFDSVTFLSFFILIGKFLEAYSKARTGDAVAMLSNLRPSEAILVQSDGEVPSHSDKPQQTITTRIPVDLLELGDIINIPHGTSPPTDGTINQPGTFLFDESSLTGESRPVKKIFGDKVFAGSVNVSQPVRVQVTDIGGTSMLDQIVAVVREGQAKRAPIERIADVITGYFVPVITLIAIVTFVTWLGLGESGRLPKAWLDVDQGGWTFWSLEFAIAVFVVACPCGIGLAAPTALFVGGGLAAKHGVLVQGGGEAFQEASKIDVVVFDKTGTLTEGQMKVTDYEVIGNKKEQEHDVEIGFLLIKSLEESSNHPIAKAIVEFCAEKTADSFHLTGSEIQEVPGQGMTGTFTVQRALGAEPIHFEAAIGNQRLLSNIGINGDSGVFIDPILSKFQDLGHSTAVFSMRRKIESGLPNELFKPLLILAISDPLRQTTASVLHTLQSKHKIEIHMCTGDNETTARAIAAQVGIPSTQIRAGVLPQDKSSYIRELQHSKDGSKRRIVAFVGDGTNDTPALAAADVSIALSSGSDVAVNAASFILLNSDLQTVLELVRLAKRVFWRVKANFVWAAVYNVALVPVAAGVFYAIGQWRLGPVWASAAMAASSVSVVLSSLALRLPELSVLATMGRRE